MEKLIIILIIAAFIYSAGRSTGRAKGQEDNLARAVSDVLRRR